MIHDIDPDNQLDFCFDILVCLTRALADKDDDQSESLAMLCQQTEWALRDAFKRIQEAHRAELEAAKSTT